MGWCHEFGPQIAEGCDHPMAVAGQACQCPTCAARCTGRFKGCQAVWSRAATGPAFVARRREPTVTDPPEPMPEPAPTPEPAPDLALALEAIGSELRAIRKTLDNSHEAHDVTAEESLATLLERIPERIRDVFPQQRAE